MTASHNHNKTVKQIIYERQTKDFSLRTDYYFCQRDEMEKAIGNGDFLEHAEYSNNLYGTRYIVIYQI